MHFKSEAKIPLMPTIEKRGTMAIITPQKPQGAKGTKVSASAPAPKGVIIGAQKKNVPLPIEAQKKHKTQTTLAEIFPRRFTALTALVVALCLSTLALLLDVNDSLRTQALKAKLASAATKVNHLFITDLVEDTMSYDARVTLNAHQPRRSVRSVPPMKVSLGVDRRSPQSLAAQVLRIINDSNKRQKQARRLALSIVSESVRQNYDPLFVAAVIKSESAFNEMAVSNKGAQGLMQIMPGTGKYLAKSSTTAWPTEVKLTDAGYNLHLGIKYLKDLEEMFQGNRLLTLIAYNWGPGKLDRAIRSGRGVPAECLQYALKILRDHKLWEDGPSAMSA